MYINKIDEFFDSIIDDFYNKIVQTDDFEKIHIDPNFVKYQLDINKMLINYTKNINRDSINEVLHNENNTNKVIDIVKKYLAYYIFMNIAAYYKGKLDTFINNVIEFSKNQPGFNFKINDFFNSESNSNTIKFYQLIKNLLEYLNGKSNDDPKKFKDAMDFLKDFNEDLINQSFRLENLNNNANLQIHNLIKTILLSELYFKNDKKNVYLLIDKSEKETGEYIYIDVVYPTRDFIDYNVIELSLSQEDVDNGFATEVYDLITKCDQTESIHEYDTDFKIKSLIESKIIVPIVEDFLLYHKDSEKYDKNIAIENKDTNPKKKDDTKIKYIINKIDNVTEYFSKNTNDKPELKKEIKKLFYQPLSDRRAVVINNYEDIKIINKLQNQGRRAIENNEYYNDLLNYKQYPYINFKDFQNYGFPFMIDKTYDVIRSVTFEKINTHNKNKYIQFRVNNAGEYINIIGFAFISGQLHLKCHKSKNFVNIRNISYKKNNTIIKTENGYNGFVKYIFRNFFDSNDSNKKLSFNKNSTRDSLAKKKNSIYWIFDLEKDKIILDRYDASNKANNMENSKLIITKLYDDIIKFFYDKIYSIFKNNPKLTWEHFYKLINFIQQKYFYLDKENDLYNQLEKFIYYDLIIKTPFIYDQKKDEFPGLFGNIITLPTAPPPKKVHYKTLIISKDFLGKKIKKPTDEFPESSSSSDQLGNVICQHNVTWDNISAIRKKFPNQFSELFFQFVQQYVIRNHEQDFICKSCGFQVNIRNYVLDGSYDDEGRFVSFTMPMDVPLKDIPEYEKYLSTIRNIEKIIEKIASITNMTFLIGTTTTVRMRIRKIVKDSIDLLLIHNSNMKNIYKERNEKISKYGLNKDLSNFFVFELDNNIFVYSSKDKDFYKPIKRNNILIYIIFLLILEISDSQILYMTGDKICNYYLYSKYATTWFDGIYIKKNNQNTMIPVKDYQVLCYIIFFISCSVTKYNLWHFENSDEKKKRFDPTVQKIIIQTFFDFLNSVLEIFSKKKKNFIYDLLVTRFYQKLNSTFKNNDILNKIKAIETKKISVEGKKIRFLSQNYKPLLLTGFFTNLTLDISDWNICRVARSYITKRINLLYDYYSLSNVTNCPDGMFHKWFVKGKTLSCAHCGINMNDIDQNANSIEEIITNYRTHIKKKTSSFYCKTGAIQNFVKTNQFECKICLDCKNIDFNKISAQNLDELFSYVNKLNQNKLTFNFFNPLTPNKKQFLSNVKNQFSQQKNNYIENFISQIESIIGKDVNIDNRNIYLRYNSYIIDHDQNGYSLDKPIYIKNNGTIIHFKKNHPFFNTDVIYYTNNKLGVDVFYNATSKLLLGFKEKNKDFKYARKNNIYLKEIPSIYNQVKKLGYQYSNIPIKNDFDNLMKIYSDSQIVLKILLADIGRYRISSLKKFITDTQKIIYNLVYNYSQKFTFEDQEPMDYSFLNKYKNKLGNIVLSNNKYSFFKNWKTIKNFLFFENLSERTINLDANVNNLLTEEISPYDYNGNCILFYVINEFEKLLENNNDKFTKTTLTYLLIDIIIFEYNLFNQDINLTDTEIKRFKYTLEVINDRDILNLYTEGEGFYDELADETLNEEQMELIREQREDDIEENEAYDLGDQEEMDYEIDYQNRLNFSG